MGRLNLSLLVALFLALCGLTTVSQTPIHSNQVDRPSAPGEITRRDKYVGDSSCSSCHEGRALSYLHTAHHLTSQQAGRDAIQGSFQKGSNVLMITNPSAAAEAPGLYFRMESKDGSYYETAVFGWPGEFQKRTERIDIVIGSGVRGQTYLYWQGDQLYELPVSYWSDGHRWINSPGYADGTMDFSRPVDPRCLECHATYIQPRSEDPFTNSYYRGSLVTGISCESCHGPGADHVAMHRAQMVLPGKPMVQAILNPARFSRDRQVDLCSLCHNGIRQKETKPAFSYIPGQPLDNYLVPQAGDTEAQPNVHGDQVGLLKKSRCYQSSPNMSCSTCHDVHAPEQPAASYSIHCLSCHRVASCGMSKTIGAKIANECVDCHMPLETTTAIVSQTAAQIIRPKLRTHWIKVYAAPKGSMRYLRSPPPGFDRPNR